MIRKNLKIIITIIITAFICISGTVYATQILAKDILFTPQDDSWKKENGDVINNVEDAINSLYNESTQCDYGTFVPTDGMTIFSKYKPSFFIIYKEGTQIDIYNEKILDEYYIQFSKVHASGSIRINLNNYYTLDKNGLSMHNWSTPDTFNYYVCR